MSQMNTAEVGRHVLVVNPTGASSVVLACEHASPFIPPAFAALGLSEEDQQSHAAWDPGALAVAAHLSRLLDAVLVASGVSRLVYDCNRPPDSPSAMPEVSEVIQVPGNVDLTEEDRARRVRDYYLPFHADLQEVVEQTSHPILVTIHSFTPVYRGLKRDVEVGVLHDADARLADAMLDTAQKHLSFDVQRNAPYDASDGVTHTLQKHAIEQGHLNVMLEIRNDLIATPEQQETVATTIAAWLVEACANLKVTGVELCQV